MRTSICLFRDNLRVADNLALSEAASEGGAVLPVFVLDDTTPGRWRLGGAARWWLHHSLRSLARSLESRGSGLVLLKGETAESLGALLSQCPAGTVHIQRGHAPWEGKLTERIRSVCERTRAELRIWDDRTLFAPEDVLNSKGDPFRVFTPFWRHCLSIRPPEPPIPAPGRLAAPRHRPESLSLGGLGLLPSKGDWTGGLAEAWQPGEDSATGLLEKFAEHGIGRYATDRDRPDLAGGTSRLSPHIRFGEIGVRTLWHHLSGKAEPQAGTREGTAAFLREIGWREFCHHLLHHFPGLPGEEFQPVFGKFPWTKDEDALLLWQRGRTGVPIVDAGMRQLRRTGWMHNRVRMVTASFLTKNLLVDWRDGQDWFWDNLVDADLANNSAGWQWVAGCGADAAPYFRIFNPVLQGRKFDPDGGYVRRHVSELSKVDARHIHEPWEMGADECRTLGFRPGEDYPEPMVSLPASRQRALDAYQGLRRGRDPKAALNPADRMER